MKRHTQLLKKTSTILLSIASFVLIPAAVMFNTEMSAQANTPTPENARSKETDAPDVLQNIDYAPKVSVLGLQAASYKASISAFGEVKPAYTLSLNSEVNGRVEWMAPDFAVGATIKQGEALIRLSQRDYLPAVAQAEQDLASAQQAKIAAQQGLADASRAKASAQESSHSAQEAVAGAEEAIANAVANNIGSHEAVAQAKQSVSQARQEIAAADQALKETLQAARIARQPWDKTDAFVNAQTEVSNALLALKEEKARVSAAQEDWKLSGMRGKPPELVSRQPQLAAANTRLHAAKLALQRTRFDVEEKKTELGQYKPQLAAAKARLHAAKLQLETAQQSLKKAYAGRKADAPRLKTAQSQLNTARARLNTARYEDKAAQLRFRAAEAQLLVENKRIKTAKANLQKAQQDLALTTIRAPFDAVVTSRPVSIGSYATTGAGLAELQSSTQLETTLSLSTAQWALLPDAWQDNVVQMYSDELAGSAWNGKIKRVADFIQNNTRTRDLVVAVDDPASQEKPLLAGLFIQAVMQGKTIDHLLRVPASALAASGHLWFVDDQQQLQRFQARIAFTKGEDLYIYAPAQMQSTQIVRWPLASYLPGMKVTPETGDAGLIQNDTEESS